MVNVGTGKRVASEDFVAQLLRLIDERRSNEAVAKILDLGLPDRQLDILARLAASTNSDTRKLRIYLITVVSLVRARDRALAFDLRPCPDPRTCPYPCPRSRS